MAALDDMHMEVSLALGTSLGNLVGHLAVEILPPRRSQHLVKASL